jgi:hypothetical protein
MENRQSSSPADRQTTPPSGRLIVWAAKIGGYILRRLLIIGLLGIFIVFGLFLANYSAAKADWYWSAMFPIFGLVCLGHQLIAGGTGATVPWKIVVKQALHWLGPIVAVRIVFLQLARGQMDTATVALMILLILSVTSFLAGLHFDRSFIWLSILLLLVALIGTEIEAYIWLIVAIGLVAAALVIFSALLMRRRSSAGAASA